MGLKSAVSGWSVHCMIVVICVMLSLLHSCCSLSLDTDRTKRSASTSQTSGQDVLTRRDMKTWALIRDLEEAVFNLKEHLLNVDASGSISSSKADDTDTDTDVVDPVPEQTEQTARHMEESYPEITAEVQAKKEVPDEQPKAKKPSKGEDMSLKEALEFLVSLAKEKKKEEEHDHGVQSPPASHH